ncbi:hypothetical protein H9L25_03585 [Terrisporobacter mayombei]|nr:hypothetical protein [Terrisporobacter mayombei]
MNINFSIVAVVMLFVILITIQITLNRIYVVLKEIRSLLNIKKTRE